MKSLCSVSLNLILKICLFFFQLPDHILGQMDEDDNDVPRNVADIDDCSVDPSMKDTYFTELKVFSRQSFLIHNTNYVLNKDWSI